MKTFSQNLRHKYSFLGLLAISLLVECQTSQGTLLRNVWTKDFIEGGFPLVPDELHPLRITLMTESWLEPSAYALYALSSVLFLQIIVQHKTG